MDTNNTNNKKSNIIYADLCYKLYGIFFKIHNKLGRFCREKDYANALEYELSCNSISFKKESIVEIAYDGKPINVGRYDFLVEDKIIIELKAKPFLLKTDYYQLLRYMKAKKIRLGLLVNFRNKYLKPKRIAN